MLEVPEKSKEGAVPGTMFRSSKNKWMTADIFFMNGFKFFVPKYSTIPASIVDKETSTLQTISKSDYIRSELSLVSET